MVIKSQLKCYSRDNKVYHTGQMNNKCPHLHSLQYTDVSGTQDRNKHRTVSIMSQIYKKDHIKSYSLDIKLQNKKRSFR